jgi:hypothetical protein
VTRSRVWVPESIDSHETRKAVSVLSLAVSSVTRMSYGEAMERICRLLGYLCKKGA